MKSRVLAVAIAALALLTGCATITRGTSEAWTVNTDPSGASVKLSNGFACDQTPCTFKLPRKSEFDVVIQKQGYTTARTHVTNQVSGGGGAGMAGNVLVGGIIGAGVDVYSGAMLSLKPNPLTVKLNPVAPFTPMAPAPEPAVPVSAAPAQVAPAPAAPAPKP